MQLHARSLIKRWDLGPPVHSVYRGFARSIILFARSALLVCGMPRIRYHGYVLLRVMKKHCENRAIMCPGCNPDLEEMHDKINGKIIL